MLTLVMSLLLAFLVYKGAEYLDEKYDWLDLNPWVAAALALLFGPYGIVGLIAYAVVKYLMNSNKK